VATYREIWRGNEWISEIKTGRVEPIAYKTADGTSLSGWLLLPPGYTPGVKLPVVTIVYPGTMYSTAPPSSVSPLRADFEHPQLFAALGYAVLLPSMPEPKDPTDSHKLTLLGEGVLPAVDAVIALGFADPDRIAIVGQSHGGFATLGLITQTKRFRSAIASAAYSDLTSLYGTFYGQYRYGDAGPPQKGQVLRMLQFEKGALGMAGSPWAEPDRYRNNSAVFGAAKVETPVMLIHGDSDFVPVQQAEEFFTALYRQDKRALFVRYQGEGHTISSRANVLDLWGRIESWLSETFSEVTCAYDD
jgi:dipeptidyl aminopeptidase/acylaminoacyl peptidase